MTVFPAPLRMAVWQGLRSLPALIVRVAMRTIAMLSAFVFVACSNGSTTGPGGFTGVGTFTATVDGSPWISTTNQVAGGGSGSNQVPGLITMTGTQVVSSTDYTIITLTLGYIAGVGTYPLGVNQGTTAGGSGSVYAQQGATSLSTWATNFPGNAGTVTVTSLTSTRITGTFQFTAPPQAISTTTGTRIVTNGEFDMPLPAGFVAVPADNYGSRISALIGGTPWNGATVTALGTGGVFVFGAINDTLSISISPGTVMSAGSSYPIGGPGGATMTVTRAGTAKSWGAATGTSVGTLQITTLANGRASGMFSATLVPGPGTTGSLVIAQGAFDVRILSP